MSSKKSMILSLFFVKQISGGILCGSQVSESDAGVVACLQAASKTKVSASEIPGRKGQ